MPDINIQDFKEQCERSFYKEIYRDETRDFTLVLEETTGRVCVRKTLSVYNPQVYRWLKENPHPNLPRIYMVSEESGQLTVMEEYIQGVTFDRYLAENKVTEEQKLRLFRNLCGAVRHLHSAEPPIIHRDLKYSNIMVTDDGILKLIDFDAAKLYRPNETRDTVFMGTQGHAAPEQYGFGASDVRTDVYGLGILIRDLFPGNKCFQKIALKAAMLKPEERYQTVGELCNDLDASSAGIPAGVHAVLRRLLPLPGFRTNTFWKMGIAIVGYITVTATSFSWKGGSGAAGIPLFIEKCAIFAAFLTWVDICTDWTGLYDSLPYIHSEKKSVRITASIAWCLAVLVFWLFVASLLEVFYDRMTG